jgi:hypothetical protein
MRNSVTRLQSLETHYISSCLVRAVTPAQTRDLAYRRFERKVKGRAD